MKLCIWLPRSDFIDVARKLAERGIVVQVHHDHNVVLVNHDTKRFDSSSINVDAVFIYPNVFPVPDDYVEYDSVYHRWVVRFWSALCDLLNALMSKKAVLVSTGGMFARFLATRKGLIPSNVSEIYVELPWGLEIAKRIDSYDGVEQYHDLWDIGDYGQRALYYYVLRRIASRGFQCSSSFVACLPFLRRPVRVSNGIIVDPTTSPSAIEVGLTPLASMKAYGSYPASAWFVKVSNPNSYNLVDYQIRIDLSSVLSEPTYLMIVDEDGNELPYCFEQPNGECTTNPTTVVWVKVSRIPSNGSITLTIMRTTINRAKHGDDVFDFYDDFRLGFVDTNKWDRYDNNYFVVRNEQLVVRDGTAFRYLVSKRGFAPPIIVEARIRFIEGMDADGSIAVLNGSNASWSRGYTHHISGLAGSGTYGVIAFTPSDVIGRVCTFNGQGTEFHIAGYIVRSASEIEAFTFATGSRQSCTISTSGFGSVYVGIVDDAWHDGAFQNAAGDQSIVDWVRVRKHAEQEPMVEIVGDNSISGEIEQSIVVVGFNPPIVVYGVDIQSIDDIVDVVTDFVLGASKTITIAQNRVAQRGSL